MKTYQMTTNAIKWRITDDKDTDETHHQVTSCCKPLAQPRDSMTREECAAFGRTKSTGEGRKRRLCVEYQNGFL